MPPSIQLLRECFIVVHGHLIWKRRPRHHFANVRGCNIWNSRSPGKEAGYLADSATAGKRWLVCIGNRMYTRYQIIWAICKGVWPSQVDHRNRVSTDDRIENLRIASTSQNGANCKKSSRNTSGVKGVSWSEERHKWVASITVRDRRYLLGRFKTLEQARQAYLEAAKKHFGEFACAG